MTRCLTFTKGNFDDARVVRTAVFMEEQGFKNEFESRDLDPAMIHVTAYDKGKLIGCARVFPASLEPGFFEARDAEGYGVRDRRAWVLGRLAVLPEERKGGVGSAILEQSEAYAKEGGASEVHLHAQCGAELFYARSGYIAYGPIEFDEHVEHQWMRKIFP